MNRKQNEKLANDLKGFIMENGLACDVRIYFNGKCYDWCKGELYGKEPEVIEGIKGSQFFDYANDETVSMSFENEIYNMVNYGEYPKTMKAFEDVFNKHGVYYELGNAWNLSVYEA